MPTWEGLSRRRSALGLGAIALCGIGLGSPVFAQGPPPPPRQGHEGPPPAQDEDHGRPVALVARELGVTPEQFRAAFKKVHPAGPGQQPTEAQRQANRKVLSEALGVSPERLDTVMDKYRPGGRGDNGPARPRFSGRPANPIGAQAEDHGRPVALVAKELGVTPEQFRAAFKKVRPAPAGQHPTEAQRKANRKVLSEALGVSPERLDAVMDKYRPGGRENNGPTPPLRP